MQKVTGNRARGAAGFSLIELMVALGVTLIITVIAAQLLAQSLNVRARENARIEAITDVQRALQMMSREIGNAGLGLTNNGLVPADCDASELRVRSNLNAFTEATLDTTDPDEDIVYAIINNTTGGSGDNQRLVTRQDISTGTVMSVANRIDDLLFEYLNEDGTTVTNAADAEKVRITVSVWLRAVGSPGRPGYQPASRTRLVSEVALRNSALRK